MKKPIAISLFALGILTFAACIACSTSTSNHHPVLLTQIILDTVYIAAEPPPVVTDYTRPLKAKRQSSKRHVAQSINKSLGRTYIQILEQGGSPEHQTVIVTERM